MAEFWGSLDGYEQAYIIVILSYIPILILGIASSFAVNSTFRKYQGVFASAGATAAEACRHMLDQNDLQHVMIVRASGHLTDHYNPRTQTIALSDAVYGSSSVGALGVACHEAGHAIQHDKKYVFSVLRNVLVPVVNVVNRIFFPILLIGMVLGFLGVMAGNTPLGLILIGIAIILFGVSMLFSLITLPTEFNASRRAKAYLASTGAFSRQELAGAKKVLTAAAMTYVSAFLMSTVQFLLYVLRLVLLLRRRN